jgi:aconitate hydratase
MALPSPDIALPAWQHRVRAIEVRYVAYGRVDPNLNRRDGHGRPVPHNLTRKIIQAHLADGTMEAGAEVALKMDQALLQDATGTLAWLEFEQIGLDAVQLRQATQYIDHNMLQTGFENADDHLFLQGMCARYGAVLSKPGNGISHWAHAEAFDVPGETMLGCDSHTPHAGCCGMLAIGAGGLEVGWPPRWPASPTA